MNEEVWSRSADPSAMVEYLRASAETGNHILSPRKSRLFAVSCCRLAKPSLKIGGVDPYGAAERFADTTKFDDEFRTLRIRVRQLARPFDPSVLPVVRIALSNHSSPFEATLRCLEAVNRFTAIPATDLALAFREMVGNPFRPVAFDRSWRTSTAVALAEGIYADRTFDRLPILADALEDAGCGHPDMLAHCRGDGPHARGCWVVDLVLGKS